MTFLCRLCCRRRAGAGVVANTKQLIIMGPIIPVNLRAKAKIKSEFNQNCNTFKQI